MADLKVALGELKEESESGTLAGPASVRASWRPWVWVAVTVVFLSISVGTWLFLGAAKKPQAALEVVPLTSYAGFENSPSFSPDGNQVVFSWNGEKQDNFDIYVKLIGSPTPLQLTTHPSELQHTTLATSRLRFLFLAAKIWRHAGRWESATAIIIRNRESSND